MIPLIPKTGAEMQPFINELVDVAKRVIFGPGDDDWYINFAKESTPPAEGERAYSRFKLSTVPYVQRTAEDSPVKVRFWGSAEGGINKIMITGYAIDPGEGLVADIPLLVVQEP